MNRLALLFAFAVAMAAAFWFPFKTWGTINQGLLAFLGLLVSALIQVIPVTANFLASDQLTPSEAQALTTSLDRQQHFWLGMLMAAVVTFVLVVIASAFPDSLDIQVPKLGEFDVMRVASGTLAFAVTFLLIRMWSIVEGIVSLQRLRSSLVMESARRRAAAEVEERMQNANLPANVVPDTYGGLYRPH